MSTELLIAILSIALNVVLVICLFFKSALNDILKDIWTRHQDKRKTLKDLLKELYSYLKDKKACDGYNLLYAVSLSNDPNSNQTNNFKMQLDMNIPLVKPANKFIRKHIAFFPKDTRDMIDKQEALFYEYSVECLSKSVSKERLTFMLSGLDNTFEEILKTS